MKTDGNEISLAESDHNDNRFFMMSRNSGLFDSAQMHVGADAVVLRLSIPVILLTSP